MQVNSFFTDRSPRCGLGFISEETISKKSLYVYDSNEKKVIKQPFVEFVEQSNDLNGPFASNQTSTVWANTYKMAASSVVVSMLLFGNPAVHNESSTLTGCYFAQMKFSAHCKTGACKITCDGRR